MPPTFATPLPQNPRSDILTWSFPPPHSQYTLTGRSRAAWHTSFVIPQLDLLLDAGLCVNRLRPHNVFLTHGHNDHILLAPAFVSSSRGSEHDAPHVFCPAEMADPFDAFIRANALLDRFGGGVVAKMERATHVTHGLRPGDEVALRRPGSRRDVPGGGYGASVMTARAFACDHTMPCLGYVFGLSSRRLRAEFVGLPGPELRDLRRAGREITAPHWTPVFAFLGDTTAATLEAGPEWLREGIPVVITECSFLYEEHRPMAERTKHTLWSELEVVVRRWPRTTFVLIHFSMRYSEAEIRAFFTEMEDAPGNIIVWADGEDGGEGG